LYYVHVETKFLLGIAYYMYVSLHRIKTLDWVQVNINLFLFGFHSV